MQDSQIRWRLRRGMRELDVLLTRWFDQHWGAATDAERAGFLQLLDCEDPDVWAWLMGHAVPPEGPLADVIRRLQR